MYKSFVKTEEIIKLYESGLSQQKVADALNISQCCVRERLVKAGIKLRKRGEHDYLIGETFGRLTVLRKSDIRCPYTGVFYDCVCSCDGNITQATPSQLKRGGKKSCGCLNHLEAQDNRGWKGCGEISLTHWSNIFNRHKIKGREFNLDIKFCWDLFLKQNRKCAISGVTLVFGSLCTKKETTASLDRIDSSKGYTKDNVQWVHKDINCMKQDFEESYFIETCCKIADYQRSKNEETFS